MTAAPVGGYVLAGGRSSRMGTDKALLPLAGEPLIAHAVAKLRACCTNVHILSSNPGLATYAPLLADLHPGCGPIGGMEAALHHSACDWNLFLPVDMPLLPADFLCTCLKSWVTRDDGARIRIFATTGRPQPGFCMIHRDVLPFLAESIACGEYKLMRAFDLAASNLARNRDLEPAAILRCEEVKEEHLRWFANLNTPADFAEADAYLAADGH